MVANLVYYLIFFNILNPTTISYCEFNQFFVNLYFIGNL